MAASLGSPVAEPARAHVGPLQRRRVLRTLGIPRLDSVNLKPVFKTGFDRRVAFADANFVQAEGTRGSMTDRGMVFVLLGPPTYVGRKPIRTGDDSSEAAG